MPSLWIRAIRDLSRFAAFIAYSSPAGFDENRKKVRLLSTGLLLVWVLSRIENHPAMTEWFITTLFTSSYLALIRQQSPAEALYCGFAFCLLTDFGRNIAFSVYEEVVLPGGILPDNNAANLVKPLISMINIPLCWLAGKYMFRRDRTGNVHWPQYVAFLCPSLAYLLFRSGILTNTGQHKTMLLLLLSVASILPLVVNKYILDAETEKNRRLEMEQLLYLQHQQYLTRSESIEILNKRYHDLKHYLSALPELAKAENLEEQVDIMKREIKEYEYVRQTGNPVIDVILSEKLRYCGENGIRLTAYVDAREMSYISSLDLCTIFGNSLDNAIEAVGKLPQDMREIHVKACEHQNMTAITISNYYSGQLQMENNLPRSTKPAGRGGWGIRNIQAAAAKYGGSCSVNCQSDRFTLNILIPRPEKGR